MASYLSNKDAIVTMILSMMGTGVTFMPYAFMSAGYLNAISLMLFFGLGTVGSCYCISYVVKHSKENSPTYSSLAHDISKYLGYLVNVSIFFNGYLAAVNFYRYLSDMIVNNSSFIREVTDNVENSRKIVVLAMAIPFIYLSMKKTLSGLAFTSYMSVISVSYLAFLMIYLFFSVGTECATGGVKATNQSLRSAVPVFISSMVCQGNMVKIYLEMKNKSSTNVLIVSSGAVIGAILINGLTGLFGYFVFGESIDGEIMSELSKMDSPVNKLIRKGWDKNNIMPKMATFGMTLTLFGGYPVQLVPVIEMLFKAFPESKRTEMNRKAIVILLFIVCILLNLLKELKTKIIKRFLGATFSNSVAFVYPFIYYMCISKKRSMSATIMCISMIVISVSVSVYTIANFLRNGLEK
ncbi:putative amino acid permease [Ordospora colligata]|nr:putative amino acid permease [Ordospora colligata]TBU14163.1 putative amino acid permease [Ordospora colligata]